MARFYFVKGGIVGNIFLGISDSSVSSRYVSVGILTYISSSDKLHLRGQIGCKKFDVKYYKPTKIIMERTWYFIKHARTPITESE